MQVQSPVGRFPLRVRRVRLRGGALRVDTALGAWNAEVTFDRGDLALAGSALVALVVAYGLGRASGGRSK
jgi:hypothetical protein